jgi:AAA15 family ATPase/GTPase
MIEKISIKNFRCFKSLSLGGLKRFNLIVGPSGSGKTALLEALFLAASGSAETYLRLRSWRGLRGPIAISSTQSMFGSIFREIFFAFDRENTVRIDMTDSTFGSRTLSISYKSELEYRLPMKESLETVMSAEPIVFKWKTDNSSWESTAEIKDGNIRFTGSTNVMPVWFNTPAAPENYVYAYSDLSKRGLTKPLVASFSKLFPRVRGISIENSSGEFALFVDIEPFEEKIPIGMLSAGMHKYLSLIIAIASSPGGFLLIDEIDTGLYYESMTAMLSSVCDFADEHNVQIIATTHSYELLQSFVSAMEGREEQFNLLRSSLNPLDGTAQLRMTRGTAAKSAISHEIEVR